MLTLRVRVNPNANFVQDVYFTFFYIWTSNLSKARETRDSLSRSCLQVVLVYIQPF